MSVLLVNGNALQIPLADESVQCVVTSPPYYSLRDYQVAGQIGLEASPEAYVDRLVEVFREVWRVLRPDGTLWLNLGDSYAGSGGAGGDYDEGGLRAGQPRYEGTARRSFRRDKAAVVAAHNPIGPKPKDLIGIPWRVAFALQADGWWLRSDIIWSKSNPMPESVQDRPTKSHEYVFLLSKSATYYYDADAIREEGSPETPKRLLRGVSDHHKNINGAPGQPPHSMNQPRVNAKYSFARNVNEDAPPGQQKQHRADREDIEYSGSRNRRTVWNIATAPYSGAHFATFPPALVEPCIRAGTSERGCCPQCGKPWERVVERKNDERIDTNDFEERIAQLDTGMVGGRAGISNHTTTGWAPGCDCHIDPECNEREPLTPVPCVVFDPFAGSGTTVMVARALGRHGIGLDLSYPYLHDQARARLQLDALDVWTSGKRDGAAVDDLPLFSQEPQP